MNQKKVANFLLAAGPIWFLAGMFLPTLIPWQWLTFIPYFILSPIVGGLIFLAGLLMRLFAPAAIQVTPQLSQSVSATPVPEVDQKEYSFWRTALIVGLVAWPVLFFVVSLGAGLIGAGGGGAARNYQANGWMVTTSALFALPIALVSLITAIYFRKNSNLRAAIHTLRIPFYYLLVVIGIQIYLEYLSGVY